MDSGGDPDALPPSLALMAREMAAVDALGPLMPASLRQARVLCRLFDRTPAIAPLQVAAAVTVLDMLTRQEVTRLEALADNQAMRRLRRRAAAAGSRGRIA